MSIDPSTDEIFFGKEISEKAKLFNAELKRIEAEHIDFFKDRKSHLQSQEHDSLFNHCITQTTSGRVVFYFTDAVLPDYIKNKCIEAFKKVYPGAEELNK